LYKLGQRLGVERAAVFSIALGQQRERGLGLGHVGELEFRMYRVLLPKLERQGEDVST
jgi:hypothetical protein